MKYTLEYQNEAIADLEKLTQTVRNRIISKINWLAENFEAITPIPLTGDLAGFYKLRVGDYRVIYEFVDEEKVVIIYRIGHRRDIYD